MTTKVLSLPTLDKKKSNSFWLDMIHHYADIGIDILALVTKALIVLALISFIIVFSVQVLATPGMLAGVLAGQTMNACHTPCDFDAAYTSVGIAWLIGIEVLLATFFIILLGLEMVQQYRDEEIPPTNEQLDSIRNELTEIRTRMGEG
jgi:hypothetical protein